MLLEAFPSYPERVFVSNGTDIRFFSLTNFCNCNFHRDVFYILQAKNVYLPIAEYTFRILKTYVSKAKNVKRIHSPKSL